MLVAAMHQDDLSLFRRMNLQSDAVIANQADDHGYAEECPDGAHVVRMITTPFRGLGLNRSTALLYASADVCLLSDEDVVLAEGYHQMVLDAFAELPRADVIIFNLEASGDGGTRRRKMVRSARRVRAHQVLGYASAARIAFRRSAVLRANVWFSPLFGAGSVYPMGEETLFLADCLRNGLRLYIHPGVLGYTSDAQSTWFHGYDEKYFRDKGAVFYSLSRRALLPLCAQDVIRHRAIHGTEISMLQKLRLMRDGACEIRDYGHQ